MGADTDAVDPTLVALAAAPATADKLPYFSGPDQVSVADFTAAGRALIGDATAIAQRATLGLTPTSSGGSATIYVDKRSEATDTRTGLSAYDFSKPFLTIAAAIAAASAGDTISVGAGTFDESNLTLNGKNLFLNGTTISKTDSTTYPIIIQSSGTSNIFGSGCIKATSTGSSNVVKTVTCTGGYLFIAPTVDVQVNSTNTTNYGPSGSSSGSSTQSVALEVTAGTCKGSGTNIYNGCGVRVAGGTWYGRAVSDASSSTEKNVALYVSSGVAVGEALVTAGGSGKPHTGVVLTGGRFIGNATCLVSTLSGVGHAAWMSGGTMQGNAFCGGSSSYGGYGVYFYGTATFIGNAVSDVGDSTGYGIYVGSGTATIIGDASGGACGVYQFAAMNMRGNAYATGSSAFAALYAASGQANFWGDCVCTSATTGIGIQATGGSSSVFNVGRADGGSSGNACVNSSVSCTVHLSGRLRGNKTQGSFSCAVYNSGGITSLNDCCIVSGGSYAVYNASGTVYGNGSRGKGAISVSTGSITGTLTNDASVG